MSDPTIAVTLDRIAPVTTVTTVASDTWRASIRLTGELDAANAGEIRAELLGHLDAGRRLLRLDASEVSFIDSTALGALVEVHVRCQAEQGTMIITGVRSPLDRMLALTRLNAVLLVDSARL